MMKNIGLFLCCFLLITAACTKDTVAPAAELNHDTGNVTAPNIAEGTYEALTRFTATETTPFQGRSLEEINFYIKDLPNRCEVIVYGAGTATAPGTLLYTENVTTSLVGDSWNNHSLSTPIELDGDDIWFGVRLVHTESTESIGCDAGPAVVNGDWIYPFDLAAWQTLRAYTSDAVDINWNIRGQVSN